ncbi:hypothetical protein TRAPUB_702 [Trametes pubescens]|uniref:F-box domain-containing protein n=1 Tax=Trametes pubescens TaxID=154538 RepID=A0A1M2VLC2_TRAPU|nr:hypothetical protein TRAPUB_702 [Trametes pubescens]
MTTAEEVEYANHLAGSAVPASPQGIQSLPNELLDLILRNVWEDKPTILAASKVSHLWHEVAVPYLFAVLKIASKFDFADFHAFLQANADLACHVRMLQLKLAWTPWTRRYKLRDDLPVVGRAQLSDLVALLPRLRALHLYHLMIIDSPNPAPGAPDHLSALRLEKLTIERCSPARHPSLVTVLNLVSLFASVDTVKLVYLHVPYKPLDPARLIRAVPVGTFITQNVSLPSTSETSTLYNPLRECLVPGHLRSLQFGCANGRRMRTVEALRSFAQLVKTAARDALRIHLPFLVAIPIGPNEHHPGAQPMLCSRATHIDLRAHTGYWREVNLRSCTSLRTLSFELAVPPADSKHTPHTPHVPLAWVCIALLADVPATLRVLTIKLLGLDANWKTQIENVNTLGLETLDVALAERHDHLERVELMLMLDAQHCTYLEECSSALLKAMPKLHAKGVLSVVDWVP